MLAKCRLWPGNHATSTSPSALVRSVVKCLLCSGGIFALDGVLSRPWVLLGRTTARPQPQRPESHVPVSKKLNPKLPKHSGVDPRKTSFAWLLAKEASTAPVMLFMVMKLQASLWTSLFRGWVALMHDLCSTRGLGFTDSRTLFTHRARNHKTQRFDSRIEPEDLAAAGTPESPEGPAQVAPVCQL